MKLLSLGPINVNQKVRELKLQNISHRSDQFKQLHKELKLKIKKFTNASEIYEVMFIPGSGTSGIEAMISSFQGKSLMVCSNGSFGDKWQLIASLYDINVVKYSNGWGIPFDNSEISRVSKKLGINNIMIVHHETSINIINNLEGFDSDINLIVDMVSSFGIESINLENSNILMCSFSSNKGSCSYPGISVVIGKIDYLKEVNLKIPFYLNLKNYYTYSLLEQTPTTPNVSILQYFNRSLDSLENGITSEKLDYITNSFEILGIYEIPISKNMKSKGINTYYYPLGINPIDFYNYCFNNNFCIYNYTKGYLLNKAFQISVMGDISIDDVKNFIKIVKKFPNLKKSNSPKLPIIVLVAGMGTRMKNKFNVPKCLIEIKGITILERQFINVSKCKQFINKLILVIGFQKELIMEEALKLSLKYSMDVEFVENTDYAITNTCKSVLKVKNESGYYLIDGDLVFDNNILESMCVFPQSCCAVSRNNPLHNQVNDHEAVCVYESNNVVTRIGKKLDNGVGESIGLYKLTKELILDCKINEMLELSEPNHYYEDSFQLAITKGYNFNMTVMDFTGYDSVEVDTIDDYNLITKLI